MLMMWAVSTNAIKFIFKRWFEALFTVELQTPESPNLRHEASLKQTNRKKKKEAYSDSVKQIFVLCRLKMFSGVSRASVAPPPFQSSSSSSWSSSSSAAATIPRLLRFFSPLVSFLSSPSSSSSSLSSSSTAPPSPPSPSSSRALQRLQCLPKPPRKCDLKQQKGQA